MGRTAYFPSNAGPDSRGGGQGGRDESGYGGEKRAEQSLKQWLPVKMHADEISTDVALVRRLLAGQFRNGPI